MAKAKTARKLARHSSLARMGTRAMLPKFWQPKIAQNIAEAVVHTHWDQYATFRDGKATEQDLWDWIESVYTYVFMAELLERETVNVVDQIREDLENACHLGAELLQQFRAEQHLVLTQGQLITVRHCAQTMDSIFEADTNGAFARAGLLAIERIKRMKKGSK